MAPELPPLLNESRNKTKVSYKRLGSSGLWVSAPILGGMSIGSSEFGSWILEEDKALPLLKAAYDRGLNTVRLLVLGQKRFANTNSGILLTTTRTAYQSRSSARP